MKQMKRESTLLLIVVALLGAFLLPGCATTAATNTKSLLTSAGFQVRTPTTAKQKEIYAALTANHLQKATVNGKVFYVFKDETAGVAYVGHEAEYQHYKQLAIQQKVAQDYYMYSEMDRYSAYRWYGGWGPRGMWW
jgi:hypothetical protein